MKILTRISFILFVVIALTRDLGAFETKSMKDCRLAFLLGMSTRVNRSSNWEIFWGPENGNAELFEEVARAYAQDLGANDEEMRTEKWRTKVANSLTACNNSSKRIAGTLNDDLGEGFGPDAWGRFDIRLSYIAGAYARYGTPSGFKMINQPKGVYLVLLLSFQPFGLHAIDLNINPGFPGNLTITLSSGDKDALSAFIREMTNIREVIAAKK